MNTATVTQPGFRFSMRQMFTAMTIAAVVLGLMVSLAYPIFGAAREASRRMHAMNNLRQLALGMHDYQDCHGRFPRAVTYNEQGQAMFGWRYALTVFLTQIGLPVDEDGTVNRHWWHFYNHSLPWNTPSNLAVLTGERESIFIRPGAKNRSIDCTNFVAVCGAETLFPDDRSSTFADITDGPSDTIMFVEIDQSDIPWYEPRDLRFDQMSFRINDPDRSKPCIGNRKSKGALVAMVDGSVRFLPADTPPETLKAMLTIAGGEQVMLPEN